MFEIPEAIKDKRIEKMIAVGLPHKIRLGGLFNVRRN